MSRHLDMRLIRESLMALIIALVADSFAGYIMNQSVGVFVAVPGLLMMLPALIDMRGNIYGAFISRLSSSLHLGEVESLRDEKVRTGIITTKSLAYSAALVVGGVVGFIIYLNTGEPFYMIFLPSIILVTHLFTASVLTPLTAYIGVKTYQKGWNPDNVGVPLISSVGDVVSVGFIVLTAIFLLGISKYHTIFFIIILAILGYVCFLVVRTLKTHDGKRVYFQSMPILVGIALLELLTGSLWESNKIAIILLILPPMLETLGNLSSIFSSRLSSFLYLGLVEPSVVPRGKHMHRELLSIFALTILIYSLISAFVFLISFDIRAVMMVWISALLSIILLLLIAYYLTIGSLKFNMDPDNVVVPVITTLADIVGTSAIVFSYYLIF